MEEPPLRVTASLVAAVTLSDIRPALMPGLLARLPTLTCEMDAARSLAPLRLPSSIFLVPNWVTSLMRLIDWMTLSSSVWSAASWVTSLAPSLAAWRTSSRALVSRLFTSSSAPSVVCTIETAVSLLSMPCCRPEICARICSEITRPAASSAARLMRRPLDSRSSDLAIMASFLIN